MASSCRDGTLLGGVRRQLYLSEEDDAVYMAGRSEHATQPAIKRRLSAGWMKSLKSGVIWAYSAPWRATSL
jgi:hypothetical protein